MGHVTPPPHPWASIREYLLRIGETGLEGIPAGMAGEVPAPPSPPEPRPNTRPPDESARHESLETIRRHLGNCERCALAKTRTNLVFGVGNPHARLVFVGEGPGADEDAQGEPFVGAAGKVLDRLITNMGLKRQDVYICNVVKCRPPGNRDPVPGEIEACSPFLLRQVRSINPEVIVALGKFACQTLLGTKEPISKLRGRFRDFHGIPLMPTYHPSFLLRRQGEGSTAPFWEVWDDMTQVLRLLKLPVPDKNRKQ